MLTFIAKGTCEFDYVKDLEMERSFWIIWLSSM